MTPEISAKPTTEPVRQVMKRGKLLQYLLVDHKSTCRCGNILRNNEGTYREYCSRVCRNYYRRAISKRVTV